METSVMYLFKSTCWLTGFGAVYYLFLRNERFFALKRYYLVAGIIAALILPLFAFHYKVTIPAGDMSQIEIASGEPDAATASSWLNDLSGLGIILVSVYVAGMLFLLVRLVRNAGLIFSSVKKSEIISYGRVRVIRSPEFRESFSFFNYVFINPSVSDKEMNEILNHELVHVGQKHWIDLLLAEFIGFLQWMNPFVWIYSGFIRLNHEYLADEVALRRTSDAAMYKAALLNQLFSSPVISLSNSFACSINKKRFEMMKEIKASPYRRMKILFVLPVLAMLFFAFAEPEYRYSAADRPGEDKAILYATDSELVKGRVTGPENKPLEGAAIIVSGTTVGTLSDTKGSFRINNVPDDAALVVSFVGFETKVVKPVFSSEMLINMIPDTVDYGKRIPSPSNAPLTPPPPPPPPPPSSSPSSPQSSPPPPPPPPTPSSQPSSPPPQPDAPPPPPPPPLTAQEDQKAGRDQLVVIEELPEFPGGMDALVKWMIQNVKYPPEAAKAKIMGKVMVSFVVTKTGEITDVNVKEPVHPLLDAEAERVISAMPGWKPGSQAGKPVDVVLFLPVEFKLK